MKKLIFSACALALAFTAIAVPARRISRTVTQPDGSTVTLTLTGDEHFHAYVTADGLAVSQAADGSFRYLTPDGLSSVIAHDLGNRSADEALFLKENINNVSFDQLSKDAPRRQMAADRNKVLRSPSAPADLRMSYDVPCTGSPRIPVLLVGYSDIKFRDGDNAFTTFTEFFKTGDTSAEKYFTDQSNGVFTPQFDVYGPINLTKTRATYGANDYYGNDKGVGAMVAEACNGLNSKVDFSQYDNDGDGVCDVVIVLYAGVGEASSTVDNSIWPCQWYLSSSDYSKSLLLDGVKVDKFAVFNELNGSSTTKIDGVGTVAHEFSHCIGLPDFYQTSSYANLSFSMGEWSLMDYGCYNNDGYLPIGYSAFEKYSLGWINLEEPDAPAKYTLPAFNSGAKDTDVALKLNSTYSNEYFIVENRQKQGWDAAMSADGLLITHVTYNSSKWQSNTLNNTSPGGYVVVPADNRASDNSTSGDLWPYSNKTEFTDTSIPAAKINSRSNTYLGKPITEMERNADGTISFWYDKVNLPTVSIPEVPESDDDIFKSDCSFTAVWSAPENLPENASVVYSLKVNNYVEPVIPETPVIAEYDFSNGESDDWEISTGYVEYDSGNSAYRLGSSKQLGGISTDFTLPAGYDYITVIVSAKGYSSSEKTLNAELLNTSGSKIATKNFTNLSSTSFNDFSWVVAVPASDREVTYTLNLVTPSSKKRSYIKAVQINRGDITATSAPAMKVDGNDDTAETIPYEQIFTDITDTSFTVTDLPANQMYEYRVKAFVSDPVSNDIFETEWSAPRTVELSGLNAVILPEAGDSTDAPAEYFTLQGVAVGARPSIPGIYIKRQGLSTSKIIVH